MRINSVQSPNFGQLHLPKQEVMKKAIPEQLNYYMKDIYPEGMPESLLLRNTKMYLDKLEESIKLLSDTEYFHVKLDDNLVPRLVSTPDARYKEPEFKYFDKIVGDTYYVSSGANNFDTRVVRLDNGNPSNDGFVYYDVYKGRGSNFNFVTDEWYPCKNLYNIEFVAKTAKYLDDLNKELVKKEKAVKEEKEALSRRIRNL